jgi:hypothetical protein
MQATLAECVGMLDKWAIESRHLACSLSVNGVCVTCFGAMTHPEPDRFVVRYETEDAVCPLTVTIFPASAVKFNYHDEREVPEQVAHIAKDVVAGIDMVFPDAAYLLLYEMKD